MCPIPYHNASRSLITRGLEYQLIEFVKQIIKGVSYHLGHVHTHINHIQGIHSLRVGLHSNQIRRCCANQRIIFCITNV